jgi:hypothetical protein
MKIPEHRLPGFFVFTMEDTSDSTPRHSFLIRQRVLPGMISTGDVFKEFFAIWLCERMQSVAR